MDAIAKIAVHKLAVSIPAIAEHPAIKISVQAKKNSTKGFIQYSLLFRIKNCAAICLGNENILCALVVSTNFLK